MIARVIRPVFSRLRGWRAGLLPVRALFEAIFRGSPCERSHSLPMIRFTARAIEAGQGQVIAGMQPDSTLTSRKASTCRP